MPQLRPSWQLSVTVAAILLATTLICRPLRRRPTDLIGAFAGEFTLVMALLALWQYIGQYVHRQVAGATERALLIFQWQHDMHLPSEVWVQQLVLPHPWLVRGLDDYYDFAHLNSMAIFLVWMWWRHRDVYPRARNTVVLTTLACLLVQAIPVAPPRLMPQLGFVDTALVYGQSVYGPFGSGIANQLAAMPSVHVGWAAIVGWYVVRVSSSRWRVIGPTHTALTVLAVVATANHWWLDGIVAVAFMALAIPGQEVARAAWRRWLNRGGPPVPEPSTAEASPVDVTF